MRSSAWSIHPRTSIDITPPSGNIAERPRPFLAHKTASNFEHESSNFEHEIGLAISHYAAKHSPLAILLYGMICVVGVFYDETVYYLKGVNPLLYFDVSDFLLSGLRHPLIFLTPIVSVILIGLLGIWLGLHKYHTKKYYIISTFVVGGATIFASIETASYKIDHCGQDISITFNEKLASPKDDGPWVLYGSTNKVIFAERKLAKDGPLVLYGSANKAIVAERKPKTEKDTEQSSAKTVEQENRAIAIPFDMIKYVKFENLHDGQNRDWTCIVAQ
jgi:hypothetical protein